MKTKQLTKKLELNKTTVANLSGKEQGEVKGGLYTTTRWSGFQFVCDSEPQNTCGACNGGNTVPGTDTCHTDQVSCGQFICTG